MKVPENVAQWIHSRRMSLDMSTAMLSYKSGVPYWRIKKFEKGEQRPGPDTFAKLYSVLAEDEPDYEDDFVQYMNPPESNPKDKIDSFAETIFNTIITTTCAGIESVPIVPPDGLTDEQRNSWVAGAATMKKVIINSLKDKI